MRRVGLPPGGSTLMTSAPSPARVSPQYSACSSASSTTRMPVKGPRAGATGAEPESWGDASMTFSNLTVAVRPGARRLAPATREREHTSAVCSRGRVAGEECSSRLLLQLDRDTPARERELHALCRRGQGHLHTALVLHGRH